MPSNRYDNMNSFIKSLFDVYNMISKSAEKQNDNKMKMIAMIISNYANFMSKEYNYEENTNESVESINLIPIFEYVAANNIELYDFSNINMSDVDVTKKEDL